jgi:hypothetical protein
MNISQDEITKIVKVVREQLSDNFYPHIEAIYNENLMIRLCNGQLSLFEINEIQNQIEGWDIFLSTSEGYLELIFRRC